jgi:ribosomal-protein-serine acetyltransferase
MQRVELDDDRHLRVYQEADVNELHALIEANREDLARWMPWAAGQDRRGTLGYLRASMRQIQADEGINTAIVERGRIVGSIGLHNVSWNDRSTNVGYWLAADARGRGTMTKAVFAFLGYAFDVWELHRVEIRAAVDNAPSRAIPERLGFREEGVLRQAQRVGDRWLDLVVYAMLAPDWAARASDRAAP